MTLVLPTRDEARAELLRRDLRRFVRAAWPVLEPGTPYVANWHIDAISDHLEAITKGELQRLIVNIPPRHMKSLAVTVFWPMWEWLTHPERRFLFASYAQSLSNRDSLKCRRLIETPGVTDPRRPDSERTLVERVGYLGLVRLLPPPGERSRGGSPATSRPSSALRTPARAIGSPPRSGARRPGRAATASWSTTPTQPRRPSRRSCASRCSGGGIR